MGKTIQVLGLINADASLNRVLVICPATLIFNWLREGAKWCVRPFHWHIVCAKAPDFVPEFAAAGATVSYGPKPPDVTGPFVVIVNYDRIAEYLNGNPLTLILKTLEWDMVVADEAHMGKNADSLRSRTVLGHPIRSPGDILCPGLISRGRRKLLLTGTPIPNRPIEIWPLLTALNPNDWPYHPFVDTYCGGKERGASNTNQLHARLRNGYMLRRTREEVLKELPKKTRQIVVLPQNGAEKVIAAERKVWAPLLGDSLAAMEVAEKAGNAQDYEAAAARLDSSIRLNLTEISRVRQATAIAKVPAVIEHLKAALAEGVGKVVCFAHHREVLEKIAAAFKGEAVLVYGGVGAGERDAAVQRFQNDPSCKVFVGGILAAGVGLTLTAAHVVVFAEEDWVPGNTDQAESRCVRIGQHYPVLVQHLVFDGTIDARMVNVTLRKQRIIDSALDGGRRQS